MKIRNTHAATRQRPFLVLDHRGMYVERVFSEATAARISGLRLWLTNEYAHDGLRQDERVLGRLVYAWPRPSGTVLDGLAPAAVAGACDRVAHLGGTVAVRERRAVGRDVPVGRDRVE